MVTRQDFLRGTMFAGVLSACPVCARAAEAAAEMSMLGDGKRLISFDKIVKVMLEAGHDLPSIYRETSKGGIAVHFTGCC